MRWIVATWHEILRAESRVGNDERCHLQMWMVKTLLFTLHLARHLLLDHFLSGKPAAGLTASSVHV